MGLSDRARLGRAFRQLRAMGGAVSLRGCCPNCDAAALDAADPEADFLAHASDQTMEAAFGGLSTRHNQLRDTLYIQHCTLDADPGFIVEVLQAEGLAAVWPGPGRTIEVYPVARAPDGSLLH